VHEADTTAVHGITDTAALVLTGDTRLTDTRTPTAHAATHATGGTDPLTPPYVGTGAAGDVMFGVKVTGDAFNRTQLTGDGALQMGTGAAAPHLQSVYLPYTGGGTGMFLRGAASTPSATVRTGTYAASDTLGPALALLRARGSYTAPTYLSAGDSLGIINFSALSDPTTPLFAQAATIFASTTETWDATHRGTAISFQTTTTGGTTLTTRARLVDGVLAIGSTPTAGASTAERLRVNTPTTLSATAAVQLAPDTATTKPLVVQGFASQSANLVEFQNSAGAVLSAITAAGTFTGIAAGLPALVTKTANYTATDADYAIFVDSTSGAVTIALPTAVGRTGRGFEIKDWKGTSATNNITVDPAGTETIDGALTKVLNAAYMALTVRSDGANWGIV
jgi:hypothetical protein